MKNRENAPYPRAWPIKALSAAVLVCLSAASVSVNSATDNKKIGDLEIYKSAEPGAATIMMMLDVSSSMDTNSIKSDYGNTCDFKSKSTYSDDDDDDDDDDYEEDDTYRKIASEKITAIVYDDNGNVKQKIVYEPKGCIIKNKYAKTEEDKAPKPRFSRLTRLKKALIELIADDVYIGDASKEKNKLVDKGSVPDNYEIGLGYYSYNGYAGVIQVPTGMLVPEQRIELILAAENLKYKGGTPTAHGFAEAGAYMMGTSTLSNISYPKVTAESNYPSGSKRYRQCLSNNTILSFNNIVKQQMFDCRTWGDWKKDHPNRSDGNNVAKGKSELTSGKEKKIYYYEANSSRNSGFLKSVDIAKKADLQSYLSPLNFDQCSGNGIYLLTDGSPYRTNFDSARQVMNASLVGSTLLVDSCSSLSGRPNDAAWGCIGDYAQILRNPKNPGLLPIKTATVGFGKSFEGLTGTKKVIVNGKEKTVTDCESGSFSTLKKDSDIRNLCRLGEIDRLGSNGEDKTLGGGGFYYTEESSEIADSIVDFAANLVQIINTAPSGTITIPDDPYRVANQLPYAYLPMIDPEIASSASIWKGNLKKYSLDQGTLFGNNSKLLYKDVAGELSSSTQDLWQTTDFNKGGNVANNDIMAGGVYAKLKTPTSGVSNIRNVFVEDVTSSTVATPVLRKIGVNGSGKVEGFIGTAGLKASVNSDSLNQRRLLSFLGFKDIISKDGNRKPLLTAGGQMTDTATVSEITLLAPSEESKLLGGVVHSAPTAVSYGADLDANGRITDTRDDYVLFGSMDGALHLVDADTGAEAFAIIPKLMMESQPEALVEGSTVDELGSPYFGVDAPWLVITDYKYDLPNKKVTVKENGMMAYGGLRMGGEAFYGIDISDKTSPKIKFSITPEGLNGESSTDFTRLGQIWSKPTAAKIRLTKGSDANKNTAPTDVLIFGGGYDMGYEDDDYTPTSTTPAKGNAIYMINAKTGELIWSTSGESGGTKNTKTNSMIHSITGEITVLDRDNDGLMDHLYAADLGGQVFRADFENARIAQFGFEAVNKFANKNITRILAPNSNDKYAYRFYNRPVVSFYRNTGGYDNGNLFALVNVISGNRSSPLSTLRDDNKYANRVYGIIDTDITSPDLYKSGFKASIDNLKDNGLLNLAAELGNTPNGDKKTTVKQKMLGEAKSANNPAGVKPSAKGWYYPLTRFDGYDKVRYNKGVGDMAAINNILYTTVYNPDKLYGVAASCAAKISGGSERQLYCLPYGICMEDNSKNGTGGYIPAGQGIQELTLGAFNDTNRDIKVLIGTTTITERIKVGNRTDFGEDSGKNSSNINTLYPSETVRPTQSGGDGSATEYLFNERYTLQPKAWYQQKTGE